MEKINNNDGTITDEAIFALMREATTVKEWNEKRENAKKFRDKKWIAANIDASKLIIRVLGKDVNYYARNN